METLLTTPCKGMHCGCTDGVSHSLECHAEHAAEIAGGMFVKVAKPGVMPTSYGNISDRAQEGLERGAWAAKPERQAQAGEPEVVAWVDPNYLRYLRDGTWTSATVASESNHVHTTALITLQSHREALAAIQKVHAENVRITAELRVLDAKKDEALNACVDALKKAAINDPLRGDVYYDAAITQAEGAMK